MLGPIDLALVVAFLAWCIWSGLRARRAARGDLEQYFLAGRTLSGWQAGISMAATQFAADTPLVVTGLVATGGVFALWRLWIYAIAFLLMALLLGGAWRRAGVLTDAELVELRYGKTPAAAALRAIKAVYFGIVFNSAVLAMVMLAATRLTEPFLLWHDWLPEAVYAPVLALVEHLGIRLALPGAAATASADNLLSLAALLAVTTMYSTTGGLRAVVRTDVLQFAIMMAATGAYAWVVLDVTGGRDGLLRGLDALFPADGGAAGGPTRAGLTAFTPGQADAASLAFVGVVAVQWLAQSNADGSGYLAQRLMACRSDHDAERAGVVFTVAQILVRSLFWLPIVVGLLVVFPPAPTPSGEYVAEREATYVRGIIELLPAGIRGLMVTGMLAAFASTLDTHLNWGSSYLTHDLWERFVAPRVLGRVPSPRSLVWTARLGTVVMVGLAVALAPELGSIQTAWQTTLLFGAGTGVVLVLRWIWWRMTAVGELAALAASLVAAPVLLLTVSDETWRLLLMALLGTVAGVAGSMLGPPVAADDLARFYARARPPGWWAPCAGDDAGRALHRLSRRTIATAGLAFSIFALLVGLGSWLLDSPAPGWMPDRRLWIGANLVMGVATLPVWRWLVRSSDA